MLSALLVTGIIFCALKAIQAERLLRSALWLAGVSALVATLLYELGAREVAVIELSVGAGLVTVLVVFVITLTGEEVQTARTLVPRPLAWCLIVLCLLLLGRLVLPLIAGQPSLPGASFTQTLWQERSLDTLLQIALIFAGVLTLLGLLAEDEKAKLKSLIRFQNTEERFSWPRSFLGKGRKPGLEAEPSKEIVG